MLYRSMKSQILQGRQPVQRNRPRARTALARVGAGLGVLMVATLMPLLAYSVNPAGASGSTYQSTDPLNQEGTAVAFAAPATGAAGSYAESVIDPAPVQVNIASGDLDDTTFSIAASNSAGCTIESDGAGFAYATSGSCVVVATTSEDDSAYHVRLGGGDEGTALYSRLAVTVVGAKATQTIDLASFSGAEGATLTLKATDLSTRIENSHTCASKTATRGYCLKSA